MRTDYCETFTLLYKFISFFLFVFFYFAPVSLRLYFKLLPNVVVISLSNTDRGLDRGVDDEK